jgi:hypothetical protein
MVMPPGNKCAQCSAAIVPTLHFQDQKQFVFSTSMPAGILLLPPGAGGPAPGGICVKLLSDVRLLRGSR